MNYQERLGNSLLNMAIDIQLAVIDQDNKTISVKEARERHLKAINTAQASIQELIVESIPKYLDETVYPDDKGITNRRIGHNSVVEEIREKWL